MDSHVTQPGTLDVVSVLRTCYLPIVPLPPFPPPNICTLEICPQIYALVKRDIPVDS